MEKTKDQKTVENKENKDQELSDDKEETEPKQDNNLNQSKTSKPKKIVYLNQKVILPSTLPDRIEYIRDLFYNEEVGFMINYAPLYQSSNVYEIGKYFKLKQKTIIEIASGILYYIFKIFKIKKIFQKQNDDKKNSSKIIEEENKRSSDDILQSGEINNVSELCELYKDLCAWGGVQTLIINGYIKKSGYKVGDTLYKHKWCLLNCGRDKQFLVDPYMFMGEERDENNKPIECKPYYFLTPPEFFIENHLPDEEKYQFMSKILKVREFTRKSQTTTEDFYNNVYKYNFKLDNYPKPEFNCKDSEVVVKFVVDSMELEVECLCNGRKLPEDKAKIADNNFRNIYNIIIVFPNNGEYKLNVIGKQTGSVLDKHVLLAFKINVKITNIIKHEEIKKKEIRKKVVTHLRMGSPQYQRTKIESTLERQLTKCSSDFDEKIKNKCFDNESAHLYEPKTKILKIGQETKFRVRVRGAKNVAVLDGRKWNYLRRKEDEIFEGNVTIENESVVLCAMRNKNIYTEVYEFLAIKR
jgi:hypothetical protein